MTDGSRIEIVRAVRATPDEVWPYLASGEMWARWQGAAATVEPRPGGTFRMTMPDGSYASGSVLAVEPPWLLRFTWGWTGAPFELTPGSTTVEIRLEPTDEGTLIRLIHTGLPGPLAPPHEQGWQKYVARLATLAVGGDPGPDD